jgi:hypothetical protein
MRPLVCVQRAVLRSKYLGFGSDDPIQHYQRAQAGAFVSREPIDQAKTELDQAKTERYLRRRNLAGG